MSVWSAFTGVIEIKKQDHFSINECAHSCFNEYVLSYKCEGYKERWRYQVELSFEEMGEHAHKVFNKFLEKLPSGAYVDVTLKVRYMK